MADLSATWLLEGRAVPWAEPEPITEPISIVPDPPSEHLGNVEEDAAAPSIPVPGPGLLPGLLLSEQQPAKTSEVSSLRFDNKYLIEVVDRLKAQNEQLRNDRATSDRDLAEAKFRNRKLEDDLASLKTQAAEARKAARAKQANRSTTRSRRQRFSNDHDWFLEEIRRAWLGRYSPQERIENYPLQPETFRFSADFFASVVDGRLDDDELRKLVRIVLDLVTGRNAVEHKHVVHPMQEGLGGPLRTRDDGALCWRMHLENGQPQAKRLHYWQLRNGNVELGWVANHDDDL